jgi:hypothetical protein
MSESSERGEDDKTKSSDERILNSIQLELSEIRKDIQYSIAPRFLEISIQTNDLVELSIDFWRMEQRINRMAGTLPKEQKEILENSLQKIKRYLNKNDIEIVDHTGQKYNEGLNLEILAVEKDEGIKNTIIKETKEPTILHKGQVVHIGKVIVVSKEDLEIVGGDEQSEYSDRD